MLSGAAVVPGAPALVPELMGQAAHELDPLRREVTRALLTLTADLLAAPGAASARLVVLGVGPPRTVDARPELSFVEFGRDARVPALASGSRGVLSTLPTSLMVARHLAHAALSSPNGVPADLDPATMAQAQDDGPRLWAAATWATVDAQTAAASGERVRDDPDPVGLVLVADGATCHGPKAPRAEDSRAGPNDDSVWDVLATGDPGGFDQVDLQLSADLGATGPVLWGLLQAAAKTQRFDAQLLWHGAPYGVGWAVSLWRRPPGD